MNRAGDRVPLAAIPAWTLVAMCIAQAMILLDNTIVNVALPSIQHDLVVTPGNLEWIVNAYVLALAALILVGGTLGDRYGRRRLMLIGLTVFTAHVGRVCAVDRRARTHHLSCSARHRRSDRCAAHAFDPVGHVPTRASRVGVRHLGRCGGSRVRRRADRRRPAAELVRLVIGLLGQRADRCRRTAAGVGGGARNRATPRRAGWICPARR